MTIEIKLKSQIGMKELRTIIESLSENQDIQLIIEPKDGDNYVVALKPYCEVR